MRWLLLLPLVLVLAACAPGSGIFSQGAWQSGGLQGQHIRTLTVDPNNPQHIYAGDTRNGVFVSTDAGIHWSRRNTGLSLPTTIHALSFDGTGTKLYAATDAGVFMSKGSAQHWVVMSGL